MTLKLAKRLQERQAGKVSLKSLEKVFLGQKVNPRLVETILLNNTNNLVLDKVRDYFIARVVVGDKCALNILVRASDEGLNKNVRSRLYAVDGLRNLAENGELSALPGLSRIMNDSDEDVRSHAVGGLLNLAQKGELGALPGLLKAVNDSNSVVRWRAVSGLQHLARLKNKQAQEKLKQIYEEW